MCDMAMKTIENSPRRNRAQSPEAFDIWVNRIGYALCHLDDRSKLNRSPLARLAYVERLAKEQYEGRLLPRGLALRELMLACIDDVVRDVGKEPALLRVCQYLHLRATGYRCQQISDEMGLSREHVSRVYRRKALELLTEQFLSTVNSRR